MGGVERWKVVALGFTTLILAACGRPAPAAGPPWETPPTTIEARSGARVIDGDTLELALDGHQLGVGLAGVAAPAPNTVCGREATGRLWALAGNGLRLERDTAQGLDGRGRWMYRAYGPDNRSVGEALVRDGLARASGGDLGTAEAEARAARRGCLWGGPAAPPASPPPGGGARLGPLSALPNGFADEVVAAGLNAPTAFTFLPDGRVLVAEKAGTVRVVKNGAALPTPFIDLRGRVNDYWDRGLLGIAADRDFAANGFVYLLYTYENDAAQYTGTKTARLTRVTAAGDAASLASETVILGRFVGATCAAFPAGADCLPSEGTSHSIGSVKVAPDGSLFVTVGDAASFNYVDDLALRAQDLDSLAGKVLRVSTSGAGLSSNPFWNGSASANRSKVWAYGVRNAFRMNLRPGGAPYLGDVGWNSWEEVNVAVGGANLGWPCFEGNGRQAGYQSKAGCQSLYAQGTGAVRPPLVAWDHVNGGASAVGGAFYGGAAYPPEYGGAYFYGDYSRRFIRFLKVDAANALVSGPADFATAVDGFVALEPGPDGNLYVLSITAGDLRRIRHVGGGLLSCPVGQFRAEYRNNKTLEGTPTFQRCEANVNHAWGRGGPENGIGVDNFSARWVGRHSFAAGDYTFSARADDGVRLWLDGVLVLEGWKNQAATTYTATQRLTAGEHELRLEYYEAGSDASVSLGWQASGNRPPTPSIASPAASLRYKVGDTVSFSGSATDPEDGAIPPAGLAWQVIVHHCPDGACHSHPLQGAAGASGAFTVPDHGDDTHLELVLTATDRTGLAGRTSLRLDPQTVQLTLATTPGGLGVVYDGTARTAPFSRATVAGSKHTISAPSPQGGLDFAAWSDGGAQQHDITLGTTDATFTASFAAPGMPAGYQRVINRDSNRCLDVSQASTANGAALIQWPCGATSLNQHWRFVATSGGYYRVVARHSGRVLHVSGGSTANGARIVQWRWLGERYQQWRPVALGGGHYKLVARHSGKVLNLPGCSQSNGVQLNQWPDLSNTCQAFRLEAVGP